ncbi:Imo32p NDAI_0D03970 [Naumovozyma dairenensis CBS 421]|uniref:AB hydrolase-1 domain-containing protein n=1 Tax=Naumovozyma dairenensis (strain ATCC 10597 / BCRC 20456 / CBS 421 / NBRC 0211 / NRRL Y-12639) TaxID=1071378 RepID=G0WAA0_NAUDC|nr:hypothetical protein NDAI_0D03970 [Naumovozyma dairenensis CBS 421]CCD24711.1 hypothetical protein NDAI_0D03970 [Naumovozyma dairenensis CBS 421]
MLLMVTLYIRKVEITLKRQRLPVRSNIMSTVFYRPFTHHFHFAKPFKRSLLYNRSRHISYFSDDYFKPLSDLDNDLMTDNIPAVELSFDHIKAKHGSGKKAPFIILHGFFGNKTNNRTLGRGLNEQLNRDIYLLDLRNHGRSPHMERHDYTSMAHDVELFIEKHMTPDIKPIIIGHSMGAKVGMSIVLRKPSISSMLVNIENAPVSKVPEDTFPRYIRQLLRICNNPDIKTMDDVDEKLKEVEQTASVRQFLMTNLTRKKNLETSEYAIKSRIPLDILNDSVIKGNISGWEFDPNFHQWKGPTLFIRGTESNYITDEYLPTIGLFFPRFEVRDVQGAGHWVNSENPNKCVEYISEFVERHEDL